MENLEVCCLNMPKLDKLKKQCIRETIILFTYFVETSFINIKK